LKGLFKILTITVFVATSAIEVHAQPYEYRLTFEVSNRAQLDSLSQMISIDKVEGRQVWAYANPQEMELFRQTGIEYNLLPDKTAAKDSYPMATTVAQMLNLNRYPTYEVFDTLMHNFERDYPQLCQLEVVATLASGRQILALKISKDVELDNTTKPEVLCTSTMHGDEGICATTALNFCNYLLSSYGTDSKVSRLLDSIEFWIIPIFNPDGMYRGSNSSISGSTRNNGNGADLNRNFPPVDGSNGNPQQPETMAMIEFFGNHHFSLSTNLHGGNECFNYPWDTNNSRWKNRITADEDWWQLVGGAYRDTAQHNSASGYFDDGCSHSANGLTRGYNWYAVEGGQQDWANYFMHCREVTIEICGTKEPTSTTTIANIWQYNKNALLNFYAESLNGVRGTVTNTDGQPLAARITISGHDKDNSWIETDARAGDYHRFLKDGTYNLTFEAEGYLPQTIAVTVVDGKPTWLNAVLLNENYALSVIPTNIDVALMESSTTQRQILIKNIGKSDNAYTLTTDNAEWMTINRTANTIPFGQTDTLTTTFSSSQLSVGDYSSTIVIQSVSQTVTVNFNLKIRNMPERMGFAYLPKKLEYSIGDTLDVSGGLLSLYYCNDSVAYIPITRQMVKGFNSSTAGIKKLEISFEGQTATFNVIVRDQVSVIPEQVVVSSVTIKDLPYKLTYDIDDTLDVRGGLLLVTYSDGATRTVPMQNSMIGGFSSKKNGSVLLTINYESFITAFSILVTNTQNVQPTIVSAVLTSLPFKLVYNIGQVIDVGGGLLTITYSNDSTAVKALQNSMVKDFDSSKAGTLWVTIEYAGTFNMFSVEIKGNESNITGIGGYCCNKPRIYAEGYQIVVENACAPIRIYDLTGRCVALRNNAAPITKISLSKEGIYIVTVGSTTEKISLHR
jgi:murein tripeptide amidase MpaA